MRPVYNEFNFLDAEHLYQVSEQLENGMKFELYVQLHSEKFLEYQKEILQEFVANFFDQAREASLSTRDIEELLEDELQTLNEKLQAFADKLRDVPKTDMRGYVQLMIDQDVKTWLIGKSTLMIFRDEKVYSVLENSYQEQGNVDQFADFIGGEMERGDVFMYAGTKLSDSLDQQDLIEMEHLLASAGTQEMLERLTATLAGRIEKKEIWFLSSFEVVGIELSARSNSAVKGKLFSFANKYLKHIGSKVDLGAFTAKTDKYFKGNLQYYMVAGVLGLLVLMLAYAVLSQFRGGVQGVSYTTSTGATAYLTLDEINDDIYAFKLLEASSDEKSNKYNEIIQKLALLESKALRPEDVKKLRDMLNAEYEKGFNVFDSSKLLIETPVLTFNDVEKQKLSTPVSLAVAGNLNIAGTRSALIGSVNDATRGSLIEYNMSSDTKNCTLSLSRKGLFCYTTGGELFYVGKAGVEMMETADGQWSTNDIGGVGVYNKTSMYLFQHSPTNFASVFLTRYQNIAGSESKYRNGQNYTIATQSGSILPTTLEWFVIDGNFMAWGDGKLYQFFRQNTASTVMDYRQVPMIGGDKVSSSYSNNVKVLASDNSPYVALFDRDNQTLTVFESSPIKTNENHKTSFKLYYMFRFKFDLSSRGDRLIDVAIPEATGDRPEAYFLTNQGVSKVNLYEFIDRIKAKKSLTEITE